MLFRSFNLTRAGVHDVSVIEPRADRQALARQFGAREVYAPAAAPRDAFDVGVECSAAPAGFAALLHLLAVLLLAVSPALHSEVHPDAADPGHSCSVTMLASGGFHAPSPHADFTADADLPLIAVVQPHTARVTAFEFSIGILEHAPPVAA